MCVSNEQRETLKHPHFAMLTSMCLQHLEYARQYPDTLAAIAKDLRTTPDHVLAIAIVDEIVESYDISPRVG
jgi:hypothetical protein